MRKQKNNIKKIKFKSVCKKFCTEICQNKNCKDCYVKEFGTWLEENKDALASFQQEYKYVIGPKECPMNIHLLLDWDKCKNCDALVYKSDRMKELENTVEE